MIPTATEKLDAAASFLKKQITNVPKLGFQQGFLNG